MKILQIRKHELKDSLSINEIENHRHRLQILLLKPKAGLNRSDYNMVNKIIFKLFFSKNGAI
jgi:hypothetical protein